MERAVSTFRRRWASMNMSVINQVRDYEFRCNATSVGFALQCDYAPKTWFRHLPAEICRLIHEFLAVHATFDVHLTTQYPYKPMVWIPADATLLSRYLCEQHNAMYTIQNNYSPALDPEKDSLYMIVRFVRYTT